MASRFDGQADEPAGAAADLEYGDDFLHAIFREVRIIAMVGASAKWNRPSSFAMKYLQGKGYKVIPINPGQVGNEILGETVYGDLALVPGRIDMVDIFRSSEAAGAAVDRAIELKDEKGIGVVWMQLGVRNDAAAARAEAAGLLVVMNRCPKIEYGRLYGELGWSGVNSGIISAKRPRLRP